MKMSNADTVLNPADRVVKCKSAYIFRTDVDELHNISSDAAWWKNVGLCILLYLFIMSCCDI